ncbi:Phosducin-like protein [Amphibalanus amphitrite]|uniref:Phosducin-like protein n=1 Tax=Amphibalanus amphitrite TaxID=1232801 RepID=A0A6A4VC16_AMPAM|nr:Phosducin-like protein [Amphibalanus amphitrite]
MVAGMATLDDKLLGEKLHYYCSSSEDEAGAADSDHDPAEDGADGAPAPPPPHAWSGAAANPAGRIGRYGEVDCDRQKNLVPLD